MRFLLLSVLFCFGCSFMTPARPSSPVALVRAQGVDLLSVNGTPLQSDATAVVIIPGRNELEFLWPSESAASHQAHVYTLVMSAFNGKEYIITPHPDSGFLCAWETIPGKKINFSTHAGCVVNQP